MCVYLQPRKKRGWRVHKSATRSAAATATTAMWPMAHETSQPLTRRSATVSSRRRRLHAHTHACPRPRAIVSRSAVAASDRGPALNLLILQLIPIGRVFELRLGLASDARPTDRPTTQVVGGGFNVRGCAFAHPFLLFGACPAVSEKPCPQPCFICLVHGLTHGLTFARFGSRLDVCAGSVLTTVSNISIGV